MSDEHIRINNHFSHEIARIESDHFGITIEVTEWHSDGGGSTKNKARLVINHQDQLKKLIAALQYLDEITELL